MSSILDNFSVSLDKTNQAWLATNLASNVDDLVEKALSGKVVTGQDLNDVHLGGITRAYHSFDAVMGVEKWEIFLGGASPSSQSSARIYLSQFTGPDGQVMNSRTVEYHHDFDTFAVENHQISEFRGSKSEAVTLNWYDENRFGSEHYQNGSLIFADQGMIELTGMSTSDFQLPYVM